MKLKVILVLLLLCLPMKSTAGMSPETFVNGNGVMLIRLHNLSEYPVHCQLSDEYSFHSFAVMGLGASMWYPVYGRFEWRCE